MGALANLLKNSPREATEARGESQESQESQGGMVCNEANPALRRARWLALCADQWLPLETVHGLSDADLEAAEDLPLYDRRRYLHTVAEGRQMAMGRLPEGFTKKAYCDGCGAVWMPEGHPDHLQACPWCLHRLAGVSLPRPMVPCGDCVFFLPYPGNPAAGTGQCSVGHRSRWAMQLHACQEFWPKVLDKAGNNKAE